MSTKPQGSFELDHATDTVTNSRYFIIHGELPNGLDPQYGYPICDSMNRHHCVSPEEDEANGNMIVHALNCYADLLAAAKGLMPEGWGDDATMDHIPGIKQARMAIAKAEGKQIEEIGNPNVAAIVHNAQQFQQRAETFADDMYDDVDLAHSGIEMSRGEWISRVTPILQRFADSECAWRNAGDVTNTMRALASAIKKIAPEAAKIIIDKYLQIDTAYKEFLNFLKDDFEHLENTPDTPQTSAGDESIVS